MTDESETQLTPDHMGAGTANILLSAFPHLAAKLAERATGVAGTSSGNTVTNYLAQYLADLPSKAEHSSAEFWRNREGGSVIPLVALDFISAPASQAFVETLFSVCGMRTIDRQEKQDEEISTYV